MEPPAGRFGLAPAGASGRMGAGAAPREGGGGISPSESSHLAVAGARKRRTHESRWCIARRISCSITSRRAEYGRAESPAHTRPPKGSGSAPAGPCLTSSPPPDGVAAGPLPCAEFGPVPPAAGACPVASGPGRPGALGPRTLHCSGAFLPTRPPPAPSSRQAPRHT